MGKLFRWLNHANWTGGIITFGDYVLRIGAAFGGGALMAWLSSKLTWFWQSFSWFGAASVALLSWFIIVIGLYLLTRRAIVRGLFVVKDEAYSEHNVSEHAPVNPNSPSSPLPFASKGLYVGQMLVEVVEADGKSVLRVKVRAFNATNHILYGKKVVGSISLGEVVPHDDTRWHRLVCDESIKLYDVDNRVTSALENVDNLNEFESVMDYPISAELAHKVLNISGVVCWELKLEDLSFMMRATQNEETLLLPLWPSLNLTRGKKIRAGRGRIRKTEYN